MYSNINTEDWENWSLSIYLHVSENVVPLGTEVVFHECLLTATVPQVEVKVAKEPHVGVFDIDGGSQPPCVPGDVVGKDDGPHRGLAWPRLAHQKDLFLHGWMIGQGLQIFSYVHFGIAG